MQDNEVLLQRKFALQRQVLDHWNELQRVKCEHERLLSELRAVRLQLETADAIDELVNLLLPAS